MSLAHPRCSESPRNADSLLIAEHRLRKKRRSDLGSQGLVASVPALLILKFKKSTRAKRKVLENLPNSTRAKRAVPSKLVIKNGFGELPRHTSENRAILRTRLETRIAGASRIYGDVFAGCVKSAGDDGKLAPTATYIPLLRIGILLPGYEMPCRGHEQEL